MTHFSVAVITYGDSDKVDELLAPYMENSCATPDEKYLEFVDETDEYRHKYENDYVDIDETPDMLVNTRNVCAVIVEKEA